MGVSDAVFNWVDHITSTNAKFWIILTVIVLTSIVSSAIIGWILLIDDDPTHEGELEYVTYTEFKDSLDEGEERSGDVVKIKDTLSAISYKASPPSSTYLSFASNEKDRRDTCDLYYYDGDITELYRPGNEVILILKIIYLEYDEDGYYSFSYSIEKIEHA